MPRRRATAATRLSRVTDGEWAGEADDEVAVEEPLEIRLNGESVAVVMRTPGDDADLVRGFLLTEGIVARAEDVLDIKALVNPLDEARGNVVMARVPVEVMQHAPWRRNFYASSSCGVCGKASIESVQVRSAPIDGDAFRIARDALVGVPDALRAAQATFDRTGGLHGAALFDSSGRLAATREDVGRHNAVDKLVGWAAAARELPASRFGLMVSGRVSFEIVQKAVAAGVPLIAAVSAPSSLAIDVAREMNVTLVGFLRGRSMNVYSVPRRIRAAGNDLQGSAQAAADQ